RLEQPEARPAQRLRILAALAAFDPESPGWKKAAAQALEPWLSDNPLYLGAWTEAFRPVRGSLMTPLTAVFHARHGRLAERPAAANILVDYAKDQPETLAELIVEADDRSFAPLMQALTRRPERAVPLLLRELDRKAEPGASEAARETLARRQSGAGLALIRL